MKHRYVLTLVLITLGYISLKVIAAVQPMATALAPEREQFRNRPPECGHLYNVGRHKEWAECMGVEYK